MTDPGFLKNLRHYHAHRGPMGRMRILFGTVILTIAILSACNPSTSAPPVLRPEYYFPQQVPANDVRAVMDYELSGQPVAVDKLQSPPLTTTSGDEKRILPGTTPINDPNMAVEIAKSVATAELAVGEPVESLSLLSAERADPQKLTEEFKRGGTSFSTPLAQITGNLWIVSFSGRFSPKRYPSENAPIFSTIVIYLKAEDGSVLGVTYKDIRE